MSKYEDLERRIKEKLENTYHDKFVVRIKGNRVEVSPYKMNTNALFDELHASSLFGREVEGEMSSYPEENLLLLPLDKMVI